MITLYQFPPAFDRPYSLSPFCAKLEAYLRLANVEHTVAEANPQRAPKGKAPYIRHDGGVLGDSSLIIEWCKTRFGDPLDGALDDEQRATGHLIQRTVEEHLYFALVYSRWLDDPGWVHQKPAIASMVPAAVRWFLPGLLRRQVAKTLRAQGVARHQLDEIYAAGAADLEALARVLGDAPFLLGEAPTSYDCAAWGQVVGILTTRSDNALTRAVRSQPNLVAWVERMTERIGW